MAENVDFSSQKLYNTYKKIKEGDEKVRKHGTMRKTLAVLTAAVLLTAGLSTPAPQTQAASAKVKKLTVKAASKTLYVGKYSPYKTTKLKVKVSPSKAKQKVKFKSLSKKVATVNASGKVTAKKKGTAKIKVTTIAKNKKGKKLSKIIKIKVKKYKAPTGLSARISTDNLQVGKTAQIYASLSGKPTCKTIVYSSSNSKVASVNSKGLVSAAAAGKAVITVKSKVKGSKGKVLQKTFTVTVTGNGQGSSNTPKPSPDSSSGSDSASPTPAPSVSPTAAPEVGAEAEIPPVKIGNLGSMGDEQADIVPSSMELNKTNELSMSGSDNGMTISMTMKLNRLNSSGNTFLWNTSGTDAYPMMFQAVTASGQLYTELDWRSQFYTTENFIPIGEEFTLVTVYTNKEIRIYLNDELKAYYNAETGYSMGGSFTHSDNTSLCPAGTTGYLATVRGSWTQYQLGVAPKCINQGSTVMSGEVTDFAVYKKALQPGSGTAKEKLIYPETAVYEISPDSDTVDFGAVLLNASDDATVTYTSSDSSIAGFTKDGKFRMIKGGQVDVKAKTSGGVEATCKVTINYSTIALHDPSVYQDPVSGYYYTVASHCLAGYSKDMKSWSLIADSGNGYSASNKLFTKSYQKEFAEVYDFVKPNDDDPEGLWAPSIIYSEKANKYFMYVTIADGTAQGKCAIVLATADKPEGPYSYEKMIVASDITASDVEKTNLMDVLGVKDASKVPSKYTADNRTYPDCIDATVFYDHTGKLWMVYGSFTCSGGIRMIQLDPGTGDRLKSATYEDTGNTTTIGDKDPYYGIRLANSNGEGPFIMEVPSDKSSTGYYYFLWTSVGGLQSYGGYHMRMFRSENVEGPYVDTAGNLATSSLGRAALGLRVMDNYKFSFMDYAYTSCGGNSAIISGSTGSEEDGKMFLHYHQKWANGTEGFVTKSNQMFLNEDGWLVTAPFAYDGESMDKTYTAEEVAGDYEFILHRTSYTKTDTVNYDYSDSVVVKLNKDGTVSGGYTGTWSFKDNYITIKVGKDTYKGVVFEQTMEDKNRTKAMVFTAVGDGNIQSVWGAKMVMGDDYYVDLDQKKISVPQTEITEDFTLPTTSDKFGYTIKWTSDNTDAVSFNGGKAAVNTADEEVEATITGTFTKGSYSKSYDWKVKIGAFRLTINTIVDTDTIKLPASYQGRDITWSSADDTVINPSTGVVNRKADADQTVTLTATVGGRQLTYEMTVKKKNAEYSQDYENVSDVSTVFTSQNYQAGVSIATESDNKFLQYKLDVASQSGNRGGESTFDTAVNNLTNYLVEFDLAATAGNSSGASQVVLTGTDCKFTSNNKNFGVESGYIFKIATGTNGTVWTINDSDQTVTLAKNTWAHVKAYVCADGKVNVIITDKAAGSELYNGTVSVNGGGKLKGLYILAGRGTTSLTKIDNIAVY